MAAANNSVVLATVEVYTNEGSTATTTAIASVWLYRVAIDDGRDGIIIHWS